MSKDQAEAILLAEQVLQTVKVSPFIHKDGAWSEYVQEAKAVMAEEVA